MSDKTKTLLHPYDGKGTYSLAVEHGPGSFEITRGQFRGITAMADWFEDNLTIAVTDDSMDDPAVSVKYAHSNGEIEAIQISREFRDKVKFV